MRLTSWGGATRWAWELQGIVDTGKALQGIYQAQGTSECACVCRR